MEAQEEVPVVVGEEEAVDVVQRLVLRRLRLRGRVPEWRLAERPPSLRPRPEASLPRSLWNPLGFRIFAGENASSLRLLHPFGEEEAQLPLSGAARD